MLGEPDSKSFRAEDCWSVYYKNLVVGLRGDGIDFIAIEYYHHRGLPTDVGLAWLEEFSQITADKFLEILRNEQISCLRMFFPGDDDKVFIVDRREGEHTLAFFPSNEGYKIRKFTFRNFEEGHWETKDCFEE